MNAANLSTKIHIAKHTVDELTPIIDAFIPGAGDEIRNKVEGDLDLKVSAGLPLATLQKIIPAAQKYAQLVKNLTTGSEELAEMLVNMEVTRGDLDVEVQIEGLAEASTEEEEEEPVEEPAFA